MATLGAIDFYATFWATAGGTATRSFTITNEELLLLGISHGFNSTDPMSAANINAVNWNTNEPIVQIAPSVTDDNNFEGVAWYRLDNPTPGTHNITVGTTSASQIGLTIVTFVESGLTVETPSITAAGGSSAADPSLTVVDTAAGDYVLAIIASDAGTAIAVAGGGTPIGEAEGVDSDSTFAGQYKVAAGANTVMSWTAAAGGPWVISGLAVSGGGAPATGGGPLTADGLTNSTLTEGRLTA